MESGNLSLNDSFLGRSFLNIQSAQEIFKKEDTGVPSNFNKFYSNASINDDKVIKLVKHNLSTIGKLEPKYKLEFKANGEVVRDESSALGRSFYAAKSIDYNYDIKNLAVFVTFLKNQCLNNKMSPEDAHKLEKKIDKAVRGLNILRENYVEKKEENCRIVDASKAELIQLKEIMHRNAEEILLAPFHDLMEPIIMMLPVYSGLDREKQVSEIRKSVHVLGDIARFTKDMPSTEIKNSLMLQFMDALSHSPLDKVTKETVFAEFILHHEKINQDKEKDSKLPEQLANLSEQIAKCNLLKHMSEKDKIALLDNLLIKSGLFETALSIKDKVIADLTPEEIGQVPWSSYIPLANYCVATGVNYALPSALAGIHPLLGMFGQIVGNAALKAAEDNLKTDDPNKIKDKANEALKLASKPEDVKKQLIEKYVGKSKETTELVDKFSNEIYKVVEGYVKTEPEKTEPEKKIMSS